MVVVDTNVLVALCVEGPARSFAESAAAKDQWCSPMLWRSEFCNVMVKLVRAGEIASPNAQSLYHKVSELMRRTTFHVPHEKALEYALRSQASAYDCEFIVLAEDFGIRLVTLDGPLIKHFPKTAIHLFDYAQLP